MSTDSRSRRAHSSQTSLESVLNRVCRKRTRRALRRFASTCIIFISIFGLLVNQTQAYNEFYLRMYMPPGPTHAFGLWHQATSYLAQVLGKLQIAFEGEDQELQPYVPPKGAPRRWQAGMPVGLYSQVNLATGRVLTTIPITSWTGGRGPDIQFSFYHNQCSQVPALLPVVFEVQQGDANADGVLNEQDIEPFVDLLLEPEPTEEQIAIADFSEDDEIDSADIGYFMTNLALQQNVSSGCTAPDWRTSYSAQIYPINRYNIVLVRDDGTEDLFTKSGSVFVGPPGVFETIVQESAAPYGYILTTKAQTKERFFGSNEVVPPPYDDDESRPAGRIDWISDAATAMVADSYLDSVLRPINRVRCRYDTSGRLTDVRSADGTSRVHLCYKLDTASAQCRGVDAGRIVSINDEDNDSISPAQEVNRRWKLLYEDPGHSPSQSGTGPLAAVEDLMGHKVRFTYDGLWDLAWIYDQNDHAYRLQYQNGRLWKVSDPSPYQYQEQWFDYAATSDGLLRTEYRDRRAKLWYYYFNSQNNNFVKFKDPLLDTQQFAYEEADPLLVHEQTKYTNGLYKDWTMHYEGPGNLRTLIDPMHHKWEFKYDEGSQNPQNPLNNLTSITPPADEAYGLSIAKKITIQYADADPDDQNNNRLPTSPTKITEPAADQNDTVNETLIEYYHKIGSSPHAYGKPHKITPPFSTAPVVTEFTSYESTAGGKLGAWREGPPTDEESGGSVTPVAGWAGSFTSFGEPQHTCAGSLQGDTQFDANGNPNSIACDASCKPLWRCTLLGQPQSCGVSALEESSDLDACFPKVGAPGCLPLAPWPLIIDTVQTFGCADSFQRRANGQVTHYVGCAEDEITSAATRTHDMQYDALNRLVSSSITSTEATKFQQGGPPFTRTFTYSPNWSTGENITTGPDGTVTITTLDDVGRLASVIKKSSPTGPTIQSLTVNAYDEANRVREVSYGNGAHTLYDYDFANRLSSIEHRTDAQTLMQRLEYTWSPDGLVKKIKEIQPDENGQPGTTYNTTTDYAYDNRNRLTEEKRDTTHLNAVKYWRVYTYDKAGNRLTKVEKDPAGTVTTTMNYTYDVSNPGYYGSQGNRLMESRSYTGSAIPANLVEHRYYLYDTGGRMHYAVIKNPQTTPATYTGTQLFYNTQGFVWLAWKTSWTGEWTSTTQRNYLSAMEYRYDGGGRERYRLQLRDPREYINNGADLNTWFLQPWAGAGDPNQWPANAGKWSDYDGDAMHDDFKLSIAGNPPTANPIEQQAHTPGLAQTAWSGTSLPAANSSYLHGNQIGSTERMTDANGAMANRTVMTAFGEPVFSSHTPQASSRFGFAGAHGYEGSSYDTGDPIADLGWLHVGARYYDPGSGRFVQRDPIGIGGGMNAYSYCANNALSSVDPSGLQVAGEPPLSNMDPELDADIMRHYADLWPFYASMAGLGILAELGVLRAVLSGIVSFFMNSFRSCGKCNPDDPTLDGDYDPDPPGELNYKFEEPQAPVRIRGRKAA